MSLETRIEPRPGRLLRILQGDITRVPAEAIANAANAQLIGGGGVDGAIHRAGGPAIMAELDALRASVAPLAAGQAVATTAGRLPARYVIHTAGPIYRDGLHGEPEALAACYRNCLRLAGERGCASIAFPAISTGVYGYPSAEAARIALDAVLAHLASHEAPAEVLLVFWSPDQYEETRDAAMRR
jgi:O-acetyl-ADP-ribose deacetylase (regulator of RNase III)